MADLNYCLSEDSIYNVLGDDIKKIVSVIADKYMSDNPVCSYEMRCFHQDGFRSIPSGQYDINLDKKYPDAKRGDYAYAQAEFYSANAAHGGLFITPVGAVTVYLNGRQIYKSLPKEEAGLLRPVPVETEWKKGKNKILLKIKKLADGFFGAGVSSISPKWAPMIFDFPSHLEEGYTGFAYSELIKKGETRDIKTLLWYPKKGTLPEGQYIAKSSFSLNEKEEVLIKGKIKSRVEIYLDKKVYKFCESFERIFVCDKGVHDILIRGTGYEIKVNKKLSPCEGMVSNDEYIYIEDTGGKLSEYNTVYRVFGRDKTYWKTKDGAILRPCLKAPLFGKWSYPLGVTLTGLYHVGKMLNREDICDYVKTHVLLCVRFYDYSVWDKKTYGYPNINQQLLWFEELDDIGSFGALMTGLIDEFSEQDKKSALKIAKRIANHIMKVQHRREDGALYRISKDGMLSMWADDLYMCVPFLVNYAKAVQDSQYLEEAAKQILLYKKYLFMPEEEIFSHVYIFNMNSDSKLAWGRGNGWTIYSLAILLQNIPKDFEKRDDLVSLFNTLADGYIKNQAEDGMFRQLINCKDSYEETSVTAMILYAFSSAIQNEFGQDNNALYESAKKSADALIKRCIDKNGNIYGVCRGSYCSFDEEYYKELLWNTNDTHGIGIVMLALSEFNKIKKEGAKQ